MREAAPMTLGNKQRLFTKLLARLIDYGYSRGYEFSLGEGYDPTGKHHMSGSMHYIKLAQDLNLFILGNYVTGANKAWDDLGNYWEKLHPLARWGGRFRSKDYNHLSFTHEGRALGKRVVAAETACMTKAQKLAARKEAKRGI